MADVILNLVEPLEDRYRWKDKTENQISLAKKDMVEAFRHHKIEDLKAAVMYITLHRKFATMPNVADIADVLSRIVAERKLAEQKPEKNIDVSRDSDVFMDGSRQEREAAQAWAREWLLKTPMGKESLAEGWCRSLHGIVWQLKLSRTKAGRDLKFEDIELDDLATQTMRGEKLIAYFRACCRALNPAFERELVLKPKKYERATVLGEAG